MQGPGENPVPHALPALDPIFQAVARMGRDANGHILQSERIAWLDEEGIEDPDERAIVHRLLDIYQAETNEAESERREELQEELRNRH